MGFLRILRDSAKVPGDSQGFSGIPRKLYEVSGVSNPSMFLFNHARKRDLISSIRKILGRD